MHTSAAAIFIIKLIFPLPLGDNCKHEQNHCDDDASCGHPGDYLNSTLSLRKRVELVN
jgi:hypothetical protein